jgi:hypothetical protein
MLMNVNHDGDGDAEGHAVHLQLVCALHSAPICDEQNAADLPRRRWGVVEVACAHCPSHVKRYLTDFVAVNLFPRPGCKGRRKAIHGRRRPRA